MILDKLLELFIVIGINRNNNNIEKKKIIKV